LLAVDACIWVVVMQAVLPATLPLQFLIPILMLLMLLCYVMPGMAGSGKTTLIQRINSYMHQQKLNGYIINLDPAVSHLPYGANIDIRDTVSKTFAVHVALMRCTAAAS
jgi:hypothetical protein